MNAVRLESAHGIGNELVVVIEYETVLSSRGHAAHGHLEDAVIAARELVLSLSFTREANTNVRRARSPHRESNARAGNHRCATLQLPQIRHWNCDVSNKWTCGGRYQLSVHSYQERLHEVVSRTTESYGLIAMDCS